MALKSPETKHLITGILFDKDGTLIDFNRTWLPLYRQAARYLAGQAGKTDANAVAEELLSEGGFNATDQTWAPDSLLASGSNQQIYSAWSEQLNLDITDSMLEECRRIFTLRQGSYAPVSDRLLPFLRDLRSRAIKLGVATMDDESSAISTLTQLGCLDEFDFVCGADSGFGVKPEAGMVHAFCRSCGLSAAGVAMVGDSPRDLKMGRNADVGLTIGVLTGTTNAASLSPYADYVFENIHGLEQLLEPGRQ